MLVFSGASANVTDNSQSDPVDMANPTFDDILLDLRDILPEDFGLGNEVPS